MLFLRKYAEATTFEFGLRDTEGVLPVSSAAYASGDVTIGKDGGAETNVDSGFSSTGKVHIQPLTATEMTMKQIQGNIEDQGSPTWLGRSFTIETYGHSSSQHPNVGVAYALPTDVTSNLIAINSLQASVNSLAVTTTEIIDQTGIEGGMPRIEAGDTFQFTKNWNTVPNSSQVNIFHRSTGTIVVSGAVATQSGTSANFFYEHSTNATSGYTTVNSNGIYVIEFIAFRDSFNDQDNDYFEVIKTNG